MLKLVLVGHEYEQWYEQLEGSWTRWCERLLVQEVHCCSSDASRGTDLPCVCEMVMYNGMDGYWKNIQKDTAKGTVAA